MKKYLAIISILVVSILVFAGCAQSSSENTTNKETNEETMESTGKMEEDDDKMEEVSKENDNAVKEEVMVMNQGDKAPAFSLTGIDGNTYSLEAYEGKKVYLKFWASWCPICLSGLDAMDTLSKESEDFVVLTIVTPDYKGEKESEDFKMWFSGLEQENMIVLLDEGGEVAKQYGLRAVPTSSYIGSDGILVQTIAGHIDNDLIIEKFEEIH